MAESLEVKRDHTAWSMPVSSRLQMIAAALGCARDEGEVLDPKDGCLYDHKGLTLSSQVSK